MSETRRAVKEITQHQYMEIVERAGGGCYCDLGWRECVAAGHITEPVAQEGKLGGR